MPAVLRRVGEAQEQGLCGVREVHVWCVTVVSCRVFVNLIVECVVVVWCVPRRKRGAGTGPVRVVCGVWCVMRGVWCAVCGVWCASQTGCGVFCALNCELWIVNCEL